MRVSRSVGVGIVGLVALAGILGVFEGMRGSEQGAASNLAAEARPVAANVTATDTAQSVTAAMTATASATAAAMTAAMTTATATTTARATTAAFAPTSPALTPASAPEPLASARTDGTRSVAIEYGDRTRKRVSLTFDAGSDVGYTSEILDTLRRERVIASFGLTGAWAEQNPALVKRIVAEGHHLINHTWSHDSFTGLSTGRGPMSRAQRWDELDRTEAIINRLAGATTLPYFRPPYGDLDASVLADAGARGYTVTAMWAVDSAGWNGLSASRITERCLRLTSAGAILIFHVGSQSQDSAALPAIITGLRESGYEMVPVSALLAP